MTTTVPDTIEGIDLDAEVACEGSEGCPRSAALAVRFFCGCLDLVCRECYGSLTDWMQEKDAAALIRSQAQTGECVACGREVRLTAVPSLPQVVVSVVSL